MPQDRSAAKKGDAAALAPNQTGIIELYSQLHPMDSVRAGFLHIGAHVLSRRLVEWVTDASGGRAPSPVLEIGCGAGASTRLLARSFGGDVVGLDLTPASLAVSREQTDKELASRLHWVCADGQNLPFNDSSFDLVWSEACFCYMSDRAKLLNECRRLLRPGGCLVFEDWALAEGAAAKRGLGAFHRAWRMPTMETMAGYRTLLPAAGLTLLRMEQAGLDMVEQFERWHVSNGGRTFEGHLAELQRDRRYVISVLGRQGYLEARQKMMIGRFIRRGWLQIVMVLARKPAAR